MRSRMTARPCRSLLPVRRPPKPTKPDHLPPVLRPRSDGGPQAPGAGPLPDRLITPRITFFGGRREPMATTSKAQFLTEIQALLKKRYKFEPAAEKLTILESVV